MEFWLGVKGSNWFGGFVEVLIFVGFGWWHGICFKMLLFCGEVWGTDNLWVFVFSGGFWFWVCVLFACSMFVGVVVLALWVWGYCETLNAS